MKICNKLFFSFLIASSLNAQIINLYGGKTYEFAEPNLISVMQNRIKILQSKIRSNQDIIQKLKKDEVKNFKPSDLPVLPMAYEDKTRYVDVISVLPFDIPNGAGGYLYKKGYTYNVLNYIKLTHKYIVFNGNNEEELEWFKNSEFVKDYNYTIILTDGSYYDLALEIKRPVYYLNKQLLDRMQLQRTVSIISQENNQLKIDEICVRCKNLHLNRLKNKIDSTITYPYKHGKKTPLKAFMDRLSEESAAESEVIENNEIEERKLRIKKQYEEYEQKDILP